MNAPDAQPAASRSNRLATWLSALGNATSLEVLRALRTPMRANEIRIYSTGGAQPRLLSRQSVTHHLDKLAEAGFVTMEEVDVAGRDRRVYSLNVGLVFSAAEDLRRLGARGPVFDPGDIDATLAVSHASGQSRITGPRLVVVHGVHESQAYPLRDEDAEDGGWTLGRDPNATFVIRDDPSVSRRHAVIRRDASGAHRVFNLPRSTNGTHRNWTAVGEAGEILASGDVIAVGNTKLVYRES